MASDCLSSRMFAPDRKCYYDVEHVLPCEEVQSKQLQNVSSPWAAMLALQQLQQQLLQQQHIQQPQGYADPAKRVTPSRLTN